MPQDSEKSSAGGDDAAISIEDDVTKQKLVDQSDDLDVNSIGDEDDDDHENEDEDDEDEDDYDDFDE